MTLNEIFLLLLMTSVYASEPVPFPPKNITIQINSDPDKQIEVEGSLTIVFQGNKIVIKAAPKDDKCTIV